jgi:hypothetical protein
LDVTLHLPGAYDFLKYRHAQDYSDLELDRHLNGLPEQCAVFSIGLLRPDLITAVPGMNWRDIHEPSESSVLVLA